VEIKSDKKGFDAMALEQYIRQKANSKWFSAFKIPLGTYSLSGRDTTKWINRTLQKIGEKPVLYDIQQEKASSEDLCTAMKNMGFMKANVTTEKKLNGKKIKITYVLHPGEQYFINKVKYDIQDDSIKRFLLLKDSLNRGLVSTQRLRLINLTLNAKD
jgi:outer membrane protein assembly factor BamA